MDKSIRDPLTVCKQIVMKVQHAANFVEIAKSNICRSNCADKHKAGAVGNMDDSCKLS